MSESVSYLIQREQSFSRIPIYRDQPNCQIYFERKLKPLDKSVVAIRKRLANQVLKGSLNALVAAYYLRQVIMRMDAAGKLL
jgi:hypothetical protein